VVHDPLADPAAVRHEYDVDLAPIEEFNRLDALIYAVAHDGYAAVVERISDMVAEDGIVADVRSKLDPTKLRSDIIYWSL
jgi:UDP-N-acetyl-D-glucosamine/UDP-N-acetyl-D-galactosamine dehydrogenase